jgi:hypothetical protein
MGRGLGQIERCFGFTLVEIQVKSIASDALINPNSFEASGFWYFGEDALRLSL